MIEKKTAKDQARSEFYKVFIEYKSEQQQQHISTVATSSTSKKNASQIILKIKEKVLQLSEQLLLINIKVIMIFFRKIN